jgi:sugar/nucleoside kinase (ribokinase family)
MGLKAAVVARCGWDYAGRLVRKQLIKEKVDDTLLVQFEAEETDYATILIGPDGNVANLVYRGETRLTEEYVEWEKIETAWFCLSSLEGNTELLKRILAEAKKKKIKVAFNPGKKEIEKAEELRLLLKNLEVLVVNQEEAAMLTESSFYDPRLGQKIAALSEGIVVVTRGAEGAYLYDGQDKLLEGEGFRVEMVDATGAGDGFMCGLVAGLVKGWSTEQALKLGLANGASVVTEVGAKKGLIKEEYAHNWLDKELKMEWK